MRVSTVHIVLLSPAVHGMLRMMPTVDAALASNNIKNRGASSGVVLSIGHVGIADSWIKRNNFSARLPMRRYRVIRQMKYVYAFYCADAF